MDYHSMFKIMADFERYDKQTGGKYTSNTRLQRLYMYLAIQKKIINRIQQLLRIYDDSITDNVGILLNEYDLKQIDNSIAYYFRLKRLTAATA